MKEIQLYRREGNARWGTDIPIPLVALVDDEDYDRVISYHQHWRLQSAGYAGCTKRINGKSIYVMMHRFILGISDGIIHTDHLDHNRLNNQKSNLKACTQAENNANLPFTGVGRHGDKWRVWTPNPTLHLGIFNTEQEAQEALTVWRETGERNVQQRNTQLDIVSPCCEAKPVRNGKDHAGRQRYRCSVCRWTYKEEK